MYLVIELKTDQTSAYLKEKYICESEEEAEWVIENQVRFYALCHKDYFRFEEEDYHLPLSELIDKYENDMDTIQFGDNYVYDTDDCNGIAYVLVEI